MVHSPWRCFGMAVAFMILFLSTGPLIAFTVRDFSVSNGGFESRNTEMAGRIAAYRQIANEECRGEISLYSDGSQSRYYSDYFGGDDDEGDYVSADECKDGYTDVDDGGRRRRARSSLMQDGHFHRILAYSDDLVSSRWAYDLAKDGRLSVALAFKGSDLFTRSALVGMCDADEALRTYGDLESIAMLEDTGLRVHSRAIGNYVAALNGRSSCTHITDSDIETTKTLLIECRHLYDGGSLRGNCWDWDGHADDDDVIGTYTDKYLSEFASCTLEADEERCAQYNAVYDIFSALAEKNWLKNGDEKLKVSQVLPAIDCHQDSQMCLDAFSDYVEPEMVDKKYSGAQLVALAMGDDIRRDIFFRLLYSDMGVQAPLIALAVLLMIQLHSGSWWIAFMGLIQIIAAFGMGFTIYEAVLWVPYFPVLNLFSLFLVMGIGADDIFVFLDAWRQSFTILPGETPAANRLSWTMKRAGAAMLVTSITTIASLLANMISPITSIKCFGLFAAMVIVSDLILMALFIPVVVLLQHTTFSNAAGMQQEKMKEIGYGVFQCKEVMTCGVMHVNDKDQAPDGEDASGTDFFHNEEDESLEAAVKSCCCRSCCCCILKGHPDFFKVPPSTQHHIEGIGHRAPQRWCEDLWEFSIAPIILHKWVRFFFIGAIVGVASWLSTHAFEIERPTTSYMQLLKADHPLEKYDMTYVDKFDMGKGDEGFFPYVFIFGLDPVDNGNGFDPADRGEPKYKSIDVTSHDAQEWLYELCEDVADWKYSVETELATSNNNVCNMYFFRAWMETTCSDTTDDDEWDRTGAYPERTSCCDYSTDDFPYSPSTFKTCIKDWADRWAMHSSNGVSTGIWFDKKGDIKIWVVQGESNLRYTEVYDDALDWYESGNRLLKKTSKAPSGSGLKKGWFFTRMGFLSLQKSITEGALQAAGLSVVLALSVLAVMTRRLITAGFASLQIFLCVASIVGVMVLMGWNLGIIESLIFSVAVGLACDFAAHLAHAYVKQAPDERLPAYPASLADLGAFVSDASRRARAAMTELGVTITLGFVTSFIPGVFLLFSRTQFFYQFGAFISLLMSFSFIFSFCMLMPSIATVGWIDEMWTVHFNRCTKDFIRKHFSNSVSSDGTSEGKSTEMTSVAKLD